MFFYLKTFPKTLMGVAGSAIALSGTLFGANPATALMFESSDDKSSECPANDCSLKALLDEITLNGDFLGLPDEEALEQAELISKPGMAGESFTNPEVAIALSPIFEIGDFAPQNTLGIYEAEGSPTDDSNQLQVLSGSSEPGDTVIVNFTTSNDVTVNGNTLSGISEFGYYLTNPGGQTFYTGGFNNDNRQHAVVFKGDGNTALDFDRDGDFDALFNPNDYIIGFEDIDSTAGRNAPDYDYNDMVVFANIDPAESVPEPSMILGLSALAGSLFAARKRKQG